MASTFAHIENNTVTHVECVTAEFIELNPNRYPGTWIQVGSETEHPIPSPGWTFNANQFTPPQPYPSWTLINNTWQPPMPKPFGNYAWNEQLQDWLPL